MRDESRSPTSLHERALRLALKEVLARQSYTGVVPAPPDYETVARRAMEIERVLAKGSRHK